jgi:hypothetical protein
MRHSRQTETAGGVIARLTRGGILFALMFLSLGCGFSGRLSAQSNVPRGPAVVELYTSQGCSSCPPADAVLGELAQMAYLPQAQTRVGRTGQGPIAGSATAALR